MLWQILVKCPLDLLEVLEYTALLRLDLLWVHCQKETKKPLISKNLPLLDEISVDILAYEPGVPSQGLLGSSTPRSDTISLKVILDIFLLDRSFPCEWRGILFYCK